MRNAQIEIADLAGNVETMRQELELQIEHLRSEQASIARELFAVKASMKQLQDKPAAIESGLAHPASPVVEDSVPEELLLVLSAAVAAFLGRSARIRAAHYVHEEANPWAQQGRAFVQASHNLIHHG